MMSLYWNVMGVVYCTPTRVVAVGSTMMPTTPPGAQAFPLTLNVPSGSPSRTLLMAVSWPMCEWPSEGPPPIDSHGSTR